MKIALHPRLKILKTPWITLVCHMSHVTTPQRELHCTISATSGEWAPALPHGFPPSRGPAPQHRRPVPLHALGDEELGGDRLAQDEVGSIGAKEPLGVGREAPGVEGFDSFNWP